MNNISNKYVLITPAKNEAAYIRRTIESVIAQSILPIKWVIVDDGSVDDTSDIVMEYATRFPFIRLIKLPQSNERHFERKVFAINKGLETIKDVDYTFIGNLDADVSFTSNYYEELLKDFSANENLGITGGKVYDNYDGNFIAQKSSIESVAGPIQFFRRKCFEDIGGYTPSKFGLIDAIAEVTARMKGWQTVTRTDLIVNHFRKTGSEGKSNTEIAGKDGFLDYQLGIHPIWHLIKSSQIFFRKPILIGSIVRSYNYFKNYIIGTERFVSNDFIKFKRTEEKSKLCSFLRSFLHFN